MDVAGTVLDGLADERVHDIDDRRVFGGFEFRSEQGLILLQLAHGFFHEIGNRIGLLDRFQDIRFHGHHRFDFTLRDHSQIIDREKVRGIRHCNRQTVAPFPDRNDAMALGQRQGNETGGLLVWRRRREIDQGNPQILHQHFQQDGFRNQSLLDQNATESFAGAFLRRQGDFQLARSYFSCFDQHFSQAFAPLHGGSSIQSPFLRLVSFQQYPPIFLFSRILPLTPAGKTDYNKGNRADCFGRDYSGALYRRCRHSVSAIAHFFVPSVGFLLPRMTKSSPHRFDRRELFYFSLFAARGQSSGIS